MTRRPPFKRNRSRTKRRGAKRSRKLTTLLVIVAAVSVWQYITTGAISWPGALLGGLDDKLEEYSGNEDAGWRRAASAVEGIGAAREGKTPESFDLRGRVVRVSDGDTVSVLDPQNRQHKVRLFGIDTPEHDQPHGDASRRALATLVEGKAVGVVIVETDDYGRTVGTVYRGDNNINLAMVAAGNAWWYRFYAPYEHSLQAAEDSAREQGLGLWRDARPIPPWDWRRGRR